jgi:arginyl-tRNA synthetase
VCSILRKAAGLGLDVAVGDVALLTAEPEQVLIRQMLLLPEIVELAAEEDDEALTKARLKLTLASKHVLARTLNLMGMSAPESMWREGEEPGE